MLEFKMYQGTNATLATEGKVIDLVGATGKISLIPRNFKDKAKRVVLILQRENGTSCQVSCSAEVSKGLRDKSITLGHVLNFNIITTENGVSFVSMPAGALVTVDVKSLTVAEFTPSVVSFESLAV